MTGRKAQLTFFLGFQCQRLHESYQFYCPIKKPKLSEKSRFSGKCRFYGFSNIFFDGHYKAVPGITQNLQSNYKDLFKNPLILCGTSLSKFWYSLIRKISQF